MISPMFGCETLGHKNQAILSPDTEISQVNGVRTVLVAWPTMVMPDELLGLESWDWARPGLGDVIWENHGRIMG